MRGSRGHLGQPVLPPGPQPRGVLWPSIVWLLRPEDFAHPATRESVRASLERRGGRWVAVGTDWQPLAHFRTAEHGRTILRSLGYQGPIGEGQYTQWRKG